MRRHHSRVLVHAALVLLCCVLAAIPPVNGNEPELELRPLLQEGEESGELTGGLSFEANRRWERTVASRDGNRLWSGFFEIESEGSVLLDEDENHKNLWAGFSAGFAVDDASGVDTGEFSTDPEERSDEPGLGEVGKNRGSFDLGFSVRFETDQALREQLVLGGLELGYVHWRQSRWWPLLPSVVVAYEWSTITRSEVRDLAGIEDDSGSRLRAEMSWNLRLLDRVKNETLRRLGFHADLRYFEQDGGGPVLEVLRLDEATYLRLAISYDLAQSRWRWLQQVYIRYADGRLPPATEDRQSFAVGLVLTKPR